MRLWRSPRAAALPTGLPLRARRRSAVASISRSLRRCWPPASSWARAIVPDFNDQAKLGSGKELVECLTDLIAIVETPALNFARNRADDGDILGDAYEYLMRHFAVESGKSKGQFLTPAELGRPMTPYGQEKDAASSGLARLTMILPSNTTAIIWQGNTLANPQLKEGEQFKQFDSLVVNPPFSDKRWSTGLDATTDSYSRFEGFGIPPAKQGIVLRIVDAFTRQLELSA